MMAWRRLRHGVCRVELTLVGAAQWSLAGSLIALGCGNDEVQESALCEDLPQYDIREADPSRNTPSSGLPADATQGAKLIQAAERGCVTLPRFESTLTNHDNASTDAAADAGSG